jgi:hypothetical protein
VCYGGIWKEQEGQWGVFFDDSNARSAGIGVEHLIMNDDSLSTEQEGPLCVAPRFADNGSRNVEELYAPEKGAPRGSRIVPEMRPGVAAAVKQSK